MKSCTVVVLLLAVGFAVSIKVSLKTERGKGVSGVLSSGSRNFGEGGGHET